jgi:hypothetical protein
MSNSAYGAKMRFASALLGPPMDRACGCNANSTVTTFSLEQDTKIDIISMLLSYLSTTNFVTLTGFRLQQGKLLSISAIFIPSNLSPADFQKRDTQSNTHMSKLH